MLTEPWSLTDEQRNVNHESLDYLGKYVRIKKVGAGTYGTVYKARNIQSGETKALKKVKWDEGSSIGFSILREVGILKQLDHTNIIKLEEVILLSNKIYLVFEFFDYDLAQYLQVHDNRLPIEKAREFIQKILDGMLYCHIRKFIHRDLKPQNLLTNHSGSVLKIADFGLARVYPIPPRDLTPKITTVWYRPPSIILGIDRYGTAVDVWAIGCIFAEMCIGRPIFNGDCEIGVLFKIFSTLGTPDYDPYFVKINKWRRCFPNWKVNRLNEVCKDDLSELGIDLLQKMFKFPDVERISCKDALVHPFFVEKLYKF